MDPERNKHINFDCSLKNVRKVLQDSSLGPEEGRKIIANKILEIKKMMEQAVNTSGNKQKELFEKAKDMMAEVWPFIADNNDDNSLGDDITKLRIKMDNTIADTLGLKDPPLDKEFDIIEIEGIEGPGKKLVMTEFVEDAVLDDKTHELKQKAKIKARWVKA